MHAWNIGGQLEIKHFSTCEKFQCWFKRLFRAISSTKWLDYSGSRSLDICNRWNEPTQKVQWSYLSSTASPTLIFLGSSELFSLLTECDKKSDTFSVRLGVVFLGQNSIKISVYVFTIVLHVKLILAKWRDACRLVLLTSELGKYRPWKMVESINFVVVSQTPRYSHAGR